MKLLNLATLAIVAMLVVGLSAPAVADPQIEQNETINVVGVNANGAFVAVNNPGPSAPPTCFLSLLTMPLNQVGILQYETARDAKIAGKAVAIFFDDDDCVVDQIQLQVD